MRMYTSGLETFLNRTPLAPNSISTKVWKSGGIPGAIIERTQRAPSHVSELRRE